MKEFSRTAVAVALYSHSSKRQKHIRSNRHNQIERFTVYLFYDSLQIHSLGKTVNIHYSTYVHTVSFTKSRMIRKIYQ